MKCLQLADDHSLRHRISVEILDLTTKRQRGGGDGALRYRLQQCPMLRAILYVADVGNAKVMVHNGTVDTGRPIPSMASQWHWPSTKGSASYTWWTVSATRSSP
jgi:hypothetical protein